jgi:dipeptidyl aminopeptidase/acylaminoacyl peptidase
VNDVYHLSLYLTTIATRLGIIIDQEQQFLIGPSRGGMQLFLALAKFPELQSLFKKCVSLSGLLNTDISAVKNPGWAEKMARNFKFDGSKEWLDQRNPILALPKIAKKDLPFLIIQGTTDSKICLEEGYSMLKAMKDHDFVNVVYWEVFGGEHTLKNRLEYISLIRHWLLSVSNGRMEPSELLNHARHKLNRKAV